MVTPLDVYEQPATQFVAGFIGSPAMNFLAARISTDGRWVEIDDQDRLPLGDAASTGDSGQDVILGIRPEHFDLVEEGAGLIQFKVNHVEILGADTLVYGHFGRRQIDLTLRLPDIHNFDKDTLLPLSVASAKLHLFDPDTRARIEGRQATTKTS